MSKKIAILVRDRQREALRISAGLIMLDDLVDVFVLDKKLYSDKDVQDNFELIKGLDFNIYTNTKDNSDLTYLTNEEIANKLLEYDIIDPF